MTPATDAAREAIAREVKRVRFLDRYGNDYRADDERLDHIELDAADRIIALTEAASQPREGEVAEAMGHLEWLCGIAYNQGGAHELGYDPLAVVRQALTQRPPEQAGAVPADVVQLVIAAREVFDGAGICFPEADALDKALEPFSALVPYENQPADAAPTPPDAGIGSDGAGERV